MTSLADTQQQLFQYLQGKASNIDSLVTAKSPADSHRRLMIYREAYQLRLHDNLCKQFPVLRAYLRGPAFQQLAQSYLQAHPPTHFAIRNYGKDVAAFLRSAPDYASRVYLAELAEVEWCLMEMLDQTPTQPILTTADLAQLTPDALGSTCFALQDHWCLRVFHCETPAWRDALQKNAKAPPPKPLSTPQYVALWRRGYQSYYRALLPLEVEFAKALQQGQSFTQLCDLAAAQTEADQGQAAPLVVQALLTWIQDGWFKATL